MGRKIGALTGRELTGFILLTALLLAGLLSSWYLGRQQETIAGALEDGAWFALSGEWEKAKQTADAARAQWQNGWNLWAAFGDHTPMEDIDALFSQLKIYAAAGERTEFASTCAELSRHVAAMGEAHRLTWWNVL